MWSEIIVDRTRSFIFSIISWHSVDKLLLGIFSWYIGKTKSSLCGCFMWILFFLYFRIRNKYISHDFSAVFIGRIVSEYFISMTLKYEKAKWWNIYSLAGSQAGAFSYISEFHTSKTAARAVACSSILLSGLAMFMSPLAMIIMPMDWTWHIFSLDFKPWRLFMVCISFINLWNGIVFAFLPESPRFLIVINEKEKALQVLRRVYAFNTGQPEEVSTIQKKNSFIELFENINI